MPTPDSIVTARGEAVTLNRVTTAVYSGGVLDEAASTIQSVATKAVVSVPRQVEVPASAQGQEALRLTVLSSLDVRADRAGRRDRFTVRGRLYEVIEVKDDTHALRGTRKKSILLAQLAIPQGSA